jgi:tetratricopeptide (TPR) repeat protein
VQSKFQQIGKENALKIIDIVAAANKENIPLHPLDVRTFMLASDISRLRAQITNSGQDVLDSEHYLEEALRLSPGRQQIVYALSDLKMALGDSATAEKLLQDAVAANPRISETYVRLAYLYFYLQMYPKALDTIAQAHLHNIVFNDAEQGLLNQILASSTAATATPPAKNKKK